MLGGGSSPHARGAQRRCHAIPVGTGLIPACAGSTLSRRARTRLTAAHPRMRGEHPVKGVRITGLTGSSPHARGAQPGHRTRAMVAGLIPACAGSTTCSAGPTRTRCGSSPHARGARSTHPPGAPSPVAHPRMRGEHTHNRTPPYRGGGSSPHARGARRPRTSRSAPRRLIPACAGSTLPHLGLYRHSTIICIDFGAFTADVPDAVAHRPYSTLVSAPETGFSVHGNAASSGSGRRGPRGPSGGP